MRLFTLYHIVDENHRPKTLREKPMGDESFAVLIRRFFRHNLGTLSTLTPFFFSVYGRTELQHVGREPHLFTLSAAYLPDPAPACSIGVDGWYRSVAIFVRVAYLYPSPRNTLPT